MMKSILISTLLVAALVSLPVAIRAQSPAPITITVYPEQDHHTISPLIYGTNAQSDDRDLNITARRIGGNRLTGYNWENNSSNAGTDYLNHSDDFLTYISGIAGADAKNPGIVITAFHDSSLAMKCYSLVTLQAAGYVSADFDGTVDFAQTAPSSRWKTVRFKKGSPYALSPDLSDSLVYLDEEVNFLYERYTRTKTSHTIQGYEVDNEPALWPSTHPRIHPGKPTVSEYIAKTASIATAVKAIDPRAEIFGGVMFGYSEYLTFQDAPDWNSYKHFGSYINAYLSNLKDSSDKAGKRLLDVLDLHWYPEAQGNDKNGNAVRITQTMNADSGVAAAREQAPRTLWDPKYKENSWIGQYYSPVTLLPSLNASIATYNPGTKLAFTELNYGGDSSISGAIAMADVLGLFGKYDVYFSSYWGPIVSYVRGAYKIYRNYDGQRSTFGDISCKATTSDSSISSAYASLDSQDSTKLHVIVIYKGFAQRPDLTVRISSKKIYDTFRLFGIAPDSSKVYSWGNPIAFSSNKILIEATPQSIYHYVFSLRSDAEVHDILEQSGLICTNSQSGDRIKICYHNSHRASIRILNIQGREVKHYTELEGAGVIEWSGSSGVYEVVLQDGSNVYTKKVSIIR